MVDRADRDGGAPVFLRSPIDTDLTRREERAGAGRLRASWEPNLLLFSNPADEKARVRLTVRLSPDDGRRWPRSLVLHEGPAAYSCLAVLPQGGLGCLFEAGEKSAYERIVFARFGLDALK